MPLATSVAVSRMMSQHVNREDVSDDLGTAILNGSSPIIDYEHQKEEELAFCNRMACYLNSSNDLPVLCRMKFPSVVEAVDHKAAEQEDALHRQIHHQSSLAGSNYALPPPSDR